GEPIHQRLRALVVEAAPAHVARFDLRGRRNADRLVIALADHVVIPGDAPEGPQRQDVRDDLRAALAAHREDQPGIEDGDPQPVGAAAVADRLEAVFFQQIEDRHRALVLDIRRRAPDRLVEFDVDEAGARWSGLGHRFYMFSRIATLLACASRPSASASAIADGASCLSCSGPSFRIEVRLTKSSTDSPDEKRAERAVGSTWLEPPT